MSELKISKENATKLALSMYEGEPCRVCGQIITDASGCVYAGYSFDNKSRSAHKICWNKNLPKTQWTYPKDSE